MKKVFSTRRLTVFQTRRLCCSRRYEPQDLYVAFEKDDPRPQVLATALLSNFKPNWTVSWLEVASEERRKGYATELIFGLHRFVDTPLRLSAGSNAGEALLQKLAASQKTWTNRLEIEIDLDDDNEC